MDQSTIDPIDQHGPAAAGTAPAQLVPEQHRPEHPVLDQPVVDQPSAMTAEELALAAVELAALVEHHRQELIDTMAELTRLQRVLRAETRAAIQAIQAATDTSVAPASGRPTES